MKSRTVNFQRTEYELIADKFFPDLTIIASCTNPVVFITMSPPLQRRLESFFGSVKKCISYCIIFVCVKQQQKPSLGSDEQSERHESQHESENDEFDVKQDAVSSKSSRNRKPEFSRSKHSYRESKSHKLRFESTCLNWAENDEDLEYEERPEMNCESRL